MHALNQGFRGLFIFFKDLLNDLNRSQGDYSESKLMKKLSAYEVLLIDELGYSLSKKEQLDEGGETDLWRMFLRVEEKSDPARLSCRRPATVLCPMVWLQATFSSSGDQ